MPKSSKEVLCIIASDSILDVHLSKYLSTDIGQVVYFTQSNIAQEISFWAYNNKIEKLEWDFSSCLPEQRLDVYKSMISFCDKVAFFWDETKDDCLAAILFAKELGIKNIIHIIKN